MRIILTGGTGLIGRYLAESLAADEHEVILLSRHPGRAGDLPDGVRAAGWDAETANGWGHLADGAEAIVNLAGHNLSGPGFFPWRWTAERRRLILESRLKAGQAVVEAARAASRKPRLVIQASAIGYYGPQVGSAELDEEAPPGEDFLAQVCVQWEKATAAVKEMGVQQAVMRIGVVLSTEGGALPRLMLPFKLFAGGPMGNGRQVYSWVHVEDLARAVRFLLELEEAGGVYNVTAPNPVSNAQFSRCLGRVLGRPSFFPVPGFALRLAFGEVATIVLDGQRVLPRQLLQRGFQFQYPQLEDALRQLIHK